MSLFKVRKFWSFDLHQLAQQCCRDASSNSGSADSEPEAGSFVAAVGRFHSVGAHDVFVVARLDGFICIVQVPDAQQVRHCASSASQREDHHDNQRQSTGTGSMDSCEIQADDKETAEGSQRFADRQLLLASQLPFAIVDVKCGFFTSALKQSIAVLSFDKLLVYQVKRHQVLDLMSADQSSLRRLQRAVSGSEEMGFGSSSLNADLFSHELEEHYRIDLLTHQLCSRIVVLDKHTDSSLSTPETNLQQQQQQSAAIDQRRTKTAPTPKAAFEDANNSQGYKRTNHQSVQHLHLPQRDTIVLQYTSQLLFSIVEHKKLKGHFNLTTHSASDFGTTKLPTSSSSSLLLNTPATDSLTSTSTKGNLDCQSANSQELQLHQLARCIGPMPMTFLRDDSKADRLVISLSDNNIYCLPLNKLMSQAKQSVMKRVAQNLLGNVTATEQVASKRQQLSNSVPLIELNLTSQSDWTYELASAPLQMQTVQRAQPDSKLNQSSCQLIVLLRYNVNLLSNSGQLLWSQRFETPLICLYTYNLPAERINQSEVTLAASHYTQDRLLSLVCSDCLSTDKCSLLILEEERTVWSAVLDAKPLQLWRAHLSKLKGVLAALDVKQGLLSMNYLGTNLDSVDQDFNEEVASEADDAQLVLLGNLDRPLVGGDHSTSVQDTSEQSHLEKQKLQVEVCLEASNQWPDVVVHCSINLSPNSTTCGVFQNIIVTLEYDDLIRYENLSEYPINWCSDGVVQVQVGSCWTDRREPIRVECNFSLRSANFGGLETMEQIENETQQVGPPMIPKSLKVNVYLKFNESHSWTSLQEESFLLPINLIAKLLHIDYSSGKDQSLEDIQSNLPNYKRQPSAYSFNAESSSPYYMSDMFLQSDKDLLSLIDDTIESDLVCRGLNSESKSPVLTDCEDSKLRTIENINLLAQSLDCRLRYRNHSRASQVVRSTSEDNQLPAIVSIALKVFNGQHVIKGMKDCENNSEDLHTTIWLHLCDLSSIDAELSRELIRQHAKEWKVYNLRTELESDFRQNKTTYPVLITIESDHPIPVLFLQQHLTFRFTRYITEWFSSKPNFSHINEEKLDKLEVNSQDILTMDNFIAISVNLHDRLLLSLQEHSIGMARRYEKLKEELKEEFHKFHVVTRCILTLSKSLSNFDEQKREQYAQLSALNKQYQLNLLRILTDLEELKQCDCNYSKVPIPDFAMIEGHTGRKLPWPEGRLIC